MCQIKNIHQIVAKFRKKIAHFILIISEVTAQKFTKFLHDKAKSLACYLWKSA